jgi:phage baseplate assembly protein W
MKADAGFLGRGWAFPPTFAQGGAQVETVSGPQDVHESLQIILSTRPGERVMQESFGCELSDLAFEEVNQALLNRITRRVTDAIVRHEPRVKLDLVDIDTGSAAEGVLRIRLQYTVRATNSRFNMVYPFYLDEAAAQGI